MKGFFVKKLEMIDEFTCTPDEYWGFFLSPEFMKELDKTLGFASREELLIADNESLFHSKFRVTPKRELPENVQKMVTNGLKLLQQMNQFGSNIQELPEPMRKIVEWGKSTFKDFLNKDSKATNEPIKLPQINLSYEEEAFFNKSEKILRWTITPDMFKNVSSFTGTIEVIPTSNGCRRIVQGEFNLGIPGAGEMIEGFLVEEIGKSHQKSALFTKEWIIAKNTKT